ncbi:MAG: hypothetical protein JXA22_09910 [Candidatus Thermoplasmatota archaeon]|nr:hypothetical protein [Candidatus Thermoplasmatota archaeon]
MRGLSASNLGVADLPMGIIIAAVITSVAVPAFWSAYQSLSVNMTLEAIEEEISDMLQMVRAVMDGGVGSNMEMKFEVRHWGSATVERVEIGGPLNGSSERFMVSYSITGYGKGFLCLDPPVQMTCTDLGQINVIGDGTYHLKLKHDVIEMVHVCSVDLK